MGRKLIEIEWDGPFEWNELNGLKDETKDYGVYQIYGFHPVYGRDVLLYIGKADYQTLGKRIGQKNWLDTGDSKITKIYVGRLAGKIIPDDETWSKEIDLAEKLLISVHKPAHNSKSLSTIPEKDMQDVHVLNWGERRSLFPEVSGLRWIDTFDDLMEYEIYQM